MPSHTSTTKQVSVLYLPYALSDKVLSLGRGDPFIIDALHQVASHAWLMVQYLGGILTST